MRKLVLLGLMLWGSASAVWNQAAPGIWINRASPADGNFPRVNAVTGGSGELGSNFLIGAYVIPGAAFDLAVSCVTMTNAGVANGSLVAAYNTFTFRQTTITDTIRAGLQSKDDATTARAALAVCAQPSGVSSSSNALTAYLLKGQKMALSFPANGLVMTLGTDSEGRIVPVLDRSQVR